jgi:hypothetical protein
LKVERARIEAEIAELRSLAAGYVDDDDHRTLALRARLDKMVEMLQEDPLPGIGNTLSQVLGMRRRKSSRATQSVQPSLSELPHGEEIASIPDSAAFLLRLFLTARDRAAIPDDLEEEYRTDILPRFGHRRARLWFWTQTISTIAMRNTVCRWLLVGGAFSQVAKWIGRRIGG